MNRVRILSEIDEYLKEHGDMSFKEYSGRKDTPVRPVLIKRHFNSWSRMMTMLATKRRVGSVTMDRIDSTDDYDATVDGVEAVEPTVVEPVVELTIAEKLAAAKPTEVEPDGAKDNK